MDVVVEVSKNYFSLNSQMLASKSAVFAKNLEKGKHVFTFASAKPDIFVEFVRYVFVSKVEVVSLLRIPDLVKVAEQLGAPGMKKILIRFLRRIELFVAAVLGCYQYKLFRSPLALFFYQTYGNRSARFVDKLAIFDELKYTYGSFVCRPSIAESALFDSLVHRCELLQEFFEIPEMFDWIMSILLQCLRWSAVPWRHVKDWTKDNRTFIAPLARVYAFFTSTLDAYYTRGIHSPILRTFIRPSQGFERCLITVGGVDNSEIKAVCLQRPGLSGIQTFERNKRSIRNQHP